MIGGPIAVSGLGAEEEVDAKQSLPTAKQVKQGFDYYLALAPNRSMPEMTVVDGKERIMPDSAVRWGIQALDNYERSGRVATSSDFKTMVASARDYRGLDMNDYNVRTYANVLGEISGAASLEYYGTAVEAGVLTAETFRDGKMSKQEAEDMGTVTGAVVGGVVAQSVGVPAPIGAFVGAKIGGGTAAMVYHVLGGPSLEQRLKKMQREISRGLSKFRQEAIIACADFERQYWNEFDSFIAEYASAWTKAEEKIGWRFQLRWFDPNPGLAFQYHWSPAKRGYPQNYEGASKSRGTRKDTELARQQYSGQYVTYATEQGGHVGETRYGYYCPHVYGCPYPNLRLKQGKGVPRNVVEAALDNGIRTTEAFAARDAIWIPKSDRIECGSYPARSSDYIYTWPKDAELPAEGNIRSTYKSHINTRLLRLSDQYYRYVRARSFLRADLSRTIAAVAAEYDVYSRKTLYITEGAGVDAVNEALESSRMLSNALGAAMLVGGAGALGYAFYKALK